MNSSLTPLPSVFLPNRAFFHAMRPNRIHISRQRNTPPGRSMLIDNGWVVGQVVDGHPAGRAQCGN